MTTAVHVNYDFTGWFVGCHYFLITLQVCLCYHQKQRQAAGRKKKLTPQ